MNFRAYGIRGLVFLSLSGGLAVNSQEPLLLRDAIQRALIQSPDAAIAQAGNQDAKASAALARTALWPQLSFTEDISRGNDPVYAFGTRLRQQQFTQADFALSALNRPQPIGNFATRLSGAWTVFDSLKTQKEIHRADLFEESAASSAKATEQQIVLRVVEAYLSALYAQRAIDVAQQEQETAAALLNSAADHVRAGLSVESDRMSAEVNAVARKQELITVQGDLELAWAQLREAMGVPNLKASDLRPIESRTFPISHVEEEVKTALRIRPDLSAVGKEQAAQASAVGAARAEFGPRVNAYGNWEEDRGSLNGAGGNSWVAGVAINIDILPIGKRAQLARESAAKQRIDAQMAAYQQHIRLQVSQAHIHRQTAALSIQTAHAALDQSAESLRILKNRYGAGLATLTDLLRAEDAERQSQNNYWHAVYGNAIAYTELLYAMGKLTPDVAEELQ